MEHNRGRRTREFDDLVGREVVKKVSCPFLRAFNLGYTGEDIKSLMEEGARNRLLKLVNLDFWV